MTGELSYTDYALALKAAQHGQRLLVVHFGSGNRPICKAMEEETLSSPEVVRFTQAHFIDVKLDSEQEADLFERLIGERGALATCVVDPSEDVVAILPGSLPPAASSIFCRAPKRLRSAGTSSERSATTRNQSGLRASARRGVRSTRQCPQGG